MTRIYLLAAYSALLSGWHTASYSMLKRALSYANRTGNVHHKRSIMRAMNYIRPLVA